MIGKVLRGVLRPLRELKAALALRPPGLCAVPLLAVAAPAEGDEVFVSPARFATEEEAVAAGRRRGIGSATLEGPSTATVMSFGTWTLVYRTGEAGIAPGGGIRIAFRHLHSWGVPQVRDPRKANYVTARASNGAAVEVYGEFNGRTLDGKPAERFFLPYFPWQNILEVTLSDAGLREGETLRVVFGDRSGGAPGIRVEPFDETRFLFKVYVSPKRGAYCYPLANSPGVRVVAAAPRRLGMTMPSDAVVGEPTWCIVRAEDRYGNPATSYRGAVALASDAEMVVLPEPHTFTEGDRGAYRFEGLRFGRAGIVVVRARAAGGSMVAMGNPVRVHESEAGLNLYWGDLHGHTLFSDGRGTVEEFYDFAKRVAGLDFCAVTDHAFEVTESMWDHSKKVTNAANRPGEFVTFQAYEWSGTTDVGGDHNVFFLDDDPPILRSLSYYNYANLQMVHGGDSGTNHIEELFRRLAPRLKHKDIFVIPHWGGRRGNPAWHNEKLQRMIEVFSEHRRSEDWMAGFLGRRYRLGIIASTDDHHGNPGYGYLKPTYNWDTQEIGMAAVAVYAKEKTRPAIFRALYDRRVYATSGDRILLDVRVDGQSMGGELTASAAPRIAVSVQGTDEIVAVTIKKDSKAVYERKIGARSCVFEWRDPNFDAGVTTYYYVRVYQRNGEEAISSPVWVN